MAESHINPFQFGVAIQNPTDFIGREQLIKQIGRAMTNPSPKNISLHGERRTGKTSLLLYLTHPDSSSLGLPENHIPVYFDFQKFSNARQSDVWYALTNIIAEQIQQRSPNGQSESEKFLKTINEYAYPSESHISFSTGFSEALKQLKSSGLTLHLLFDEFEQTDINPELQSPFYGVLRSFTTKNQNLSYIIATRIGLAALKSEQGGSPLYNILSPRILTPFEEDEVSELIISYVVRAGFDLSLAKTLCKELPFLYDATGFHPFFLQALCYHLFEYLDETDWPLGQAQQKALRALKEDAEPNFQFYWNYSSEEEREFLKQLANNLPIKPSIETFAESLEDRCLIVKHESGWKIFSSLFAGWIITTQGRQFIAKDVRPDVLGDVLGRDKEDSSQEVKAEEYSQISNVAQVQTDDITDSTITTAGKDVIKRDKTNIENIQIKVANIISQLNIGKQDDTTIEPSLIELKPRMLQKIKTVFVPSSDYEAMQETFYEDRIFIVFGSEHVGKFTCAVHLGIELCEQGQYLSPKISIYRRTIRDSMKLIDVVQHPKFEQGTVCIVEEAFENGVTNQELSSPDVSSLSESLRNKKSYLILTTTRQVDKLVTLEVKRVSAVVDDLPLIFTKHLDYYDRYKESLYLPANLIELSRKEHEKLEKKFKQPFQVALFCKELSRRSVKENADELLEIAEWVGHIAQDNPHSWFNSLSLNAKLYAMLVVLFEGVDRLILNDIYINAVQTLRDQGVSNLCDPREIGLDDILNEIRAQETETLIVCFINKGFEEEVHLQISNYHQLLWSLLDMLLSLIDTFKAREYWELRKALGIAIGRLGIYHIPKLVPVLETLAQNEYGGVVAVAGSALDEICRTGSEYYPFVTNLLERWVNSGNPGLMWAVAATIWRIYDVLAFTARSNNEDSAQATKTVDNILSIFTKLVETFDQFSDSAKYEAFQKALEQAGQTERIEPVTFRKFIDGIFQIEVEVAQYMQKQLEIWATNNLRAIVHAIRQIALTHLKDIIELIRIWLQTHKESNLYIVGKMAAYQLFSQYADPEIQLLTERHLPLLGVVRPLLSTFEGNTAEVDMMMRTLAVWLQRPGWDDTIHSALLPVVNRLTPEETIIFRTSISHQWFESGFMEAQRVGQALIARSYLMEGVSMFLPKQRYGIIAFDASFDARTNHAARVGRRLYERLDSQIDMYVVRMGQTEALAIPTQAVSTADFETEHNRPRLLAPPLEALDAAKALFTLAVTWNAITDIEDIQGEEWTHRLMIASAESKREYSEDITVIPIKRHISERYLRDIESSVRVCLAQKITSLESGEWETALHEYFPEEPLTKEAIVTKLNSWVNELNNIEHTRYPNDIARIVVCTILWLASKDLSGCVEIVKTWLSQKDELPHLMGAACGKTLFKVYAHREPIPDVETYSPLLELAPLLADKDNWSGVEAVLYAARRWAVQPEWFERFLNPPGGASSELLQLVEGVLPEHYNVLSDILKSWSIPLDPDDEEPVPDTVINLAAQLQLWAALKMRQPLPELQEGHKYGLIVLDAAEYNSNVRQFFAHVTSILIEKFSKRNHETLELMVYRMGEDFPVTLPNQKPAPEILLPDHVRCPRLLSPLIETHKTENVSFILLFTDKSILDHNDWRDTLWNERIHFYSQAFKESQLPKQVKPEDVVPPLLRYLEQEIGV